MPQFRLSDAIRGRTDAVLAEWVERGASEDNEVAALPFAAFPLPFFARRQ